MPNPLSIAQKLSKTLKQEPRGADPAALTQSTFADLGTQVTDERALAAHTARGRTSFESEAGNFMDITEEQFIKATSMLEKARKDPLMKAQILKDDATFSSLENSASLEGKVIRVEEIIKDSVGRGKIKEFMQGSKLKLEKPLYVMRTDKMLTDHSVHDGKPDSIYSFTVVDPLDPKSLGEFKHTSDTHPIVYKLPPGTDILHPAGRADPHEVVVSRENLDKSTDAMIRPRYLESLAKGTAAFGAAGIVATAGSEDANAGIVSVVAKKVYGKKDFYKKYKAQHKDIRSKGKEALDATTEAIKKNGFNSSPLNTLPIDKGEAATTIIAKTYGNKVGDRVYILTKEASSGGASKQGTKIGHKPLDSEIVDIEYDGQSTYDAYLAKMSKLSAVVGVAVIAGNPNEAQAEESAQAPKEAQVAEQDDTQLHTNIQGLMDKGTDPKLIYDRLVVKEGQGRANQIMLGAMGPRVQKLRDQGVSTADIMESFRRKGIAIGGADIPEPPQEPVVAPPQTLQERVQKSTEGIAGFGVEQPDSSLTLNDGQTMSELTARINNMELKYEDLYDAAAGGTGFAPQLKASAENVRTSTNEIIYDQVSKHLPKGLVIEGIDDYGTVSIKDAKTGKVTEYDEDLLDSLLAGAYEIGGAITGAATGAKLAPPHPLAKLAGAVLGGAVGAGFGRGSDVLRHSQTLNYKISMNRMLSQMNDAGVADVTMTAIGATAFKVVSGANRLAGRGLHKAWDLFVAGNKEGATKTVLSVFGTSKEKAFKLIEDWEKITGQKVLSEEARATGAITSRDNVAAMRVLTETLPGGQDLIAAAKGEASSGAALLSQQIDKRAKDILKAADNITTGTIGSVIREKLGAYKVAVGDHFQQVKDLGLEAMKGSPYRFDFDVALIPAMQKAAKGITNPSLRKEFYNHLQNIRDFTGTPIGSEVKKATAVAKGAKANTATARQKVTALKAERTPLVLQQKAALKRAKTLKTKLAQAKATQVAKDFGLQIARLDKKIVAASENVATKAKTTTEAIDAIAKATEPTVAAGAPRSFENLLQLKASLNELSSSPLFKGHSNFAQMKAAKTGVDAEIEKAALEHMPNGKEWLAQWKKANIEFSKMKVLESNTLYKATIAQNASMDAIVKAATDGLGAISQETFMQVMGKLPVKTRGLFEGAVIKNIIKKHTVGFEGGKQSINLPAVSEQLDKLAFTQPSAKAMKRTLKQVSEVFKNDIHLQAIAGSLPMPKFQAYLTDNPAVRIKFAVASSVFNAATSRIPFSTNAGRAALVKNLGIILDNPLDHKAVQAIQKVLPDDPELKTALHQLAVQYVEAGKPEAYGKVPIYRVHRPGEFGKVADTQLGKGRLFYTDKATAESIAKQTGAKVKVEYQVHKTIATPEEVTEIVGRELTTKEMKDPEVLQLLKDRDYRGIAVGDKVMLFE